MGDLSYFASFTVNVTISSGFSGNMTIGWFINGDGWAEEPHTVSGTTVIPQVDSNAPGVATNPNPANAAIGIALNGTLTWTFGDNTDTYDLWFGPPTAWFKSLTEQNLGKVVYMPTMG